MGVVATRSRTTTHHQEIMDQTQSKMRYRHCCVDLSWKNPGEVEALQAFMEGAMDITRATFLSHVNREDRIELERNLGYAIGNEKGLHCATDWHVRYLSGTYRGKPAVAMQHSRIEYMFGGGEEIPQPVEEVESD